MAGKAVGRWERRLEKALGALSNAPDPSEIRSIEERAKALLNAPPPPRGAARWTVPIWREDGQELVELPLDPSLPAREQALRWLASAAKMRRTLDQLARRRAELDVEIREARAWADEIQALVATLPRDRGFHRHCTQRLDLLRARLLPRGLWPQPPRRRDEPRADGPVRFRLEGGWLLLAGRSGTENDFLTGRIARSDDLWFHAAHVPGAHVILRSPDGRPSSPPPEILERAAGLAAWLSKLRAQERAEVHYTRRRNVRKPRKSPPGLVRMEQSASILVRPAPPPRNGEEESSRISS